MAERTVFSLAGAVTGGVLTTAAEICGGFPKDKPLVGAAVVVGSMLISGLGARAIYNQETRRDQEPPDSPGNNRR